jgi:hypothetical protein
MQWGMTSMDNRKCGVVSRPYKRGFRKATATSGIKLVMAFWVSSSSIADIG